MEEGICHWLMPNSLVGSMGYLPRADNYSEVVNFLCIEGAFFEFQERVSLQIISRTWQVHFWFSSRVFENIRILSI
jgi:hypothetical protein